MFERAEAYEAMMGRWSRQLAPLFVEFAVFGTVKRYSMLDVAQDRCQRHWPELQERQRSLVSILLTDLLIMRELMSPTRV